jgi:hypothetical protein
MNFAGWASNLLGLHERAVAWSRRAIEANRNYSMPYFNLGIALARLGRGDEARSAVAAGHALAPSFTISGFRASFTSINRRRDSSRADGEPYGRPARGRVARVMTATRRLAAIMAIDVVGYSRLMSEDEAGTAFSVREHRDAARPIVTGFGGRIVKTMGDGLLLEFPSVVAALECAVAIQKLMDERNADFSEAKRIVYRIGVNLGDVLIEGDDIFGGGRQHRGAARSDLRAGRRADLEHGPRARTRADRRRIHRPR